MKIHPEKIVFAVYASVVVIAVGSGLIGTIFKMAFLKKVGSIALGAAIVIGFAPLLAFGCYTIWQKVSGLFRNKNSGA